MSANIFIIFPVGAQCSSMAQRVVQSLSYLFVFFFSPLMLFFEHFQQKSLRLANLQLKTPLQIGGGGGGAESRRESNNLGTKERKSCTTAE